MSASLSYTYYFKSKIRVINGFSKAYHKQLLLNIEKLCRPGSQSAGRNGTLPVSKCCATIFSPRFATRFLLVKTRQFQTTHFHQEADPDIWLQNPYFQQMQIRSGRLLPYE